MSLRIAMAKGGPLRVSSWRAVSRTGSAAPGWTDSWFSQTGRRASGVGSRQDARKAARLEKARAYVAERGHSEYADGIVAALEETPGVLATVSMLRAMGDDGLRSLAATVRAEHEARQAKIAGKAVVNLSVRASAV